MDINIKIGSLNLLKPVSINPKADIDEITSVLSKHDSAYITSTNQVFLGAIYKIRLPFTLDFMSKAIKRSIKAENLMVPKEIIPFISTETHLDTAVSAFFKTGFPELPVLDNGYLIGSLPLQSVLETTLEALTSLGRQKEIEKRSSIILQSMNEGLIVIDTDLIIQEYNHAAEKLLGTKASEKIGTKAVVVTKGEWPIFEVIKTGKPRFNVISPLIDGRIFSTNYIPMIENDKIIGVIQTFRDITEQEEMRAQLVTSRDELDRAFALTLPNSKVEHKLKTTPEYRDVYNHITGEVTITEVIPDGGYKHVVNALKILADLNNKGIMSILGINKDVMVKSIIFHDLGKSQPQLEIGQTIEPLSEFEDGPAHAQRSANIAAHFYECESDVTMLIKYHHHKEAELSDDFPDYLMPMFRLLKLVDGLSAALTRRDATIKLDVEGTRIYVYERNTHPCYNKSRVVNLFTGEITEIPDHPTMTRQPGIITK
ncbi:MAG: PAS domain-containing protein [Firmicutes bacterium]|jgi:PAS domain S-box-containing protein|nr:PAS domain-containing protein [Bacillota bacterium]